MTMKKTTTINKLIRTNRENQTNLIKAHTNNSSILLRMHKAMT